MSEATLWVCDYCGKKIEARSKKAAGWIMFRLDFMNWFNGHQELAVLRGEELRTYHVCSNKCLTGFFGSVVKGKE